MDPPGTLSQRALSSQGDMDVHETSSKPPAVEEFVATATLVSATLVPDADLNNNSNNNGMHNSSMRSSASAATSLYQRQVAAGGVQELTYKNQVLSSRHVLAVEPIVSATSENSDLLGQLHLGGGTAEPTLPRMRYEESSSATVDDRRADFVYTDASGRQRISESALTAAPPPSPPLSEKELVVQKLVQTLQYPEGLAERLYDSTRQTFTHHFWIIDNSGSMLTTDCQRVVPQDVLEVGGVHKKMELVKCSRWNELQSTILAQAQLSGLLQSPTTFRFLNHPSKPSAVHEFTIRDDGADWENAKTVVGLTKPEGTTPLLMELQRLHDRIAALADDLRAQGHRAVVVIATDGLPSDEYGETSPQVQEAFASALKQLQLLPVWIVIRLFTNERDVISYYRKLDRKLELPMECIANFLTESREIHRCNPWLNYALPLHQCREMGFNHRVFDLLDERPLTKDDVYEFLQVFFGSQPFHNAPNIHTEWKEFLVFLKQIVSSMQQQWSPHSKRMEDWIDVKKLAMEHGFRGSLRQRVNNTLPGALGGGWD